MNTLQYVRSLATEKRCMSASSQFCYAAELFALFCVLMSASSQFRYAAELFALFCVLQF
jgi:hypothetical protein